MNKTFDCKIGYISRGVERPVVKGYQIHLEQYLMQNLQTALHFSLERKDVNL